MRALLRHVPVPSFRSPFKSSSSGLPGPTGASTTASACSAKGERTTLPFAAREGLHERILESAIHDSEKHDVSSDDDDDDEDCSLDSAEFAMRSRRLSSSEIPPLSDFLDRQRVAFYEKYYSMEASDRILESAVHDSEEHDVSSDDDDCSLDSAEFAMRSRTLSSSVITLLSDFLDPQRVASYEKLYSINYDYDYCEGAPVVEKGECPLQPLRTGVRRDFPAPSEYLTRDELVSLVTGFN
eukprot:TRINITY_DN4471_c0_g1_i3.p1 TRINITY_DN4471_c0_g1~~TRINITY_DN4471_c0_g1_i3.p1  ORF type:complete len:276 (+),score=28.34 TRINITY_DN4471_c0_g1_i3:111-830(+)